MIKDKSYTRKLVSVFLEIFLIVFSISSLAPALWLIYSSFKADSEFVKDIISLPTQLHFENYVKSWNGNFGILSFRTYFFNTLFVTVVTIIILVVAATMAGYAMGRYQFKLRKVFAILIILVLAMPFESALIPLFLVLDSMKLINNLWGVILPYVALSLPFSILVLGEYFKSIPKEIEEASRIDGCSDYQIMFRIIVPISKGAIATIAILNFASIWNELILAMVVLREESVKTINTGLLLYAGQYSTKWSMMFASLTMSAVPIIVFFIIFQKQIFKGLTLGSVKG